MTDPKTINADEATDVEAAVDQADIDLLDQTNPEEDIPDLSGPEAEALINAGWHLRHIAALRHERRIVDDVYRAEFERINNIYHDRLKVLNDRIAWHTQPLVQLHARLLAANPKRKTIVLPHGTLKSTTPSDKAAPRIEIVDEEAAIAWATEADKELLTRTKVTVAIGNLKKRLAIGSALIDDLDTYTAFDTVSGEIVPGVVAFKPVTTYTIDAVDIDAILDRGDL